MAVKHNEKDTGAPMNMVKKRMKMMTPNCVNISRPPFRSVVWERTESTKILIVASQKACYNAQYGDHHTKRSDYDGAIQINNGNLNIGESQAVQFYGCPTHFNTIVEKNADDSQADKIARHGNGPYCRFAVVLGNNIAHKINADMAFFLKRV